MRLLSFDDISFDDILLDYNISDDDIFVNDILKRVYHLKLMCGRMMLGSKAPNYDAYGLRRVASPLGFRATHFHNHCIKHIRGWQEVALSGYSSFKVVSIQNQV